MGNQVGREREMHLKIHVFVQLCVGSETNSQGMVMGFQQPALLMHFRKTLSVEVFKQNQLDGLFTAGLLNHLLL